MAASQFGGTLLDQAPIGVLLVNATDLTITDANETFCRLGGWTCDELRGRSVGQLAVADDLRGAPWDTQRVLAGHVVTRERRFRRADGMVLWCQTSTKLTEQGFLVLVTDVSPVMRDREQLQLLNELARLRTDLAETLTSPDGSLPAVLDRAAAGLTMIIAEACVIALVDRERGLLVPTAFHHRDPQGEEALRATFASHPLSLEHSMAGLVAVEGKALRLADLSPERVRQWLPPQYRGYADRFPVRNLLVVPLRGSEGILGALAMARDLPYSDHDEHLVQDLGHLVALAIEDARHDAELRRANFLLETIANGLPAMVSYWDADERNVFANDAFCEFLGVSADELRGRHVKDIFGDEIYAERMPYVLRAVAGDRTPYHRSMTDASGQRHDIEITMVPNLDREGRVAGTLSLVTDVTAWATAAAELEHQALHDPLTGLANRRALLDHIQLALKQMERGSGVLALFYLDLDGFKAINDRQGHQVGDAVLVATADQIRSIVRQGDTAARLGGDEFVILCRLPDADEAEDVRSRLRAAVAQPIEIAADRTLVVTASVGLAIAAEDGGTLPEELLAAADAAMFADKAKP